MPFNDPFTNFDMLLREGVTAAKNGNKTLAWSLLTQATQLNPSDARPWLWLTETTDDLEEKREYLEQALAAEPGNVAARQGLAAIMGKVIPTDHVDVDAIKVRPSEEPIRADAKEVFLCPKCGAHMEYNIHTEKLTCLYCGFVPKSGEEISAADAEQVLDFVLPTESGHRWAVSQQNLVCDRCGAHSLWPPEQEATRCPYCGSHQLLESSESVDLVDPQALALMKVSEKVANLKARQWFGKGWFAPDDLSQQAKNSSLQPAYYPFWTFDGTMDMHWSAEVNEGTNDRPRWVMTSGVEYEMFDDVLISGLERISSKDLKGLGLFNLKDVVEFKPDYLAGWPALRYDRPVAKATLLAREKVVRKVRRELHSRVVLTRPKRNFSTGGVNWSDMTFKYILLPLWTGTYKYQGQEYKILINGQTGKVSGEKPRDPVKTFAIIASVIVTLIVLGLIGFLIFYQP